MPISLIFGLHILTTFFMTGAIWIVQLVHYPSFSYVSEEKFNSFNLFHQSSITYVVLPAMIVEIITGGILCLSSPIDKTYIFLFLLIVLIWLSTFLLSVPLHNQLLNGYNKDIISKLVFTNWPRTALWSIRSMILVYVLISVKNT